MATFNQECININIWTLKEIANLSEKIKNKYGDSNCQSWRYPSIKSSEIDVHSLSLNTKICNNYTSVLELIIDRTIYNLNLIINYLENLEGMTQFQPRKNIHRPETLSLATILFMLWERIQQLPKLRSQPFLKNPTDVSLKTSRFTQTELCKISRCSCCEMVQSFICHLIFDLEKILKNESALVKERNVMKNIIEDLSSWGAMSRWVNAITRDINKILEEIGNVKTENYRLNNLMVNRGRLLKNQISELKNQNGILERKLNESELSIVEMKKQIEDLIDEKNGDDHRADVTIIGMKKDLYEYEKIIRKLEGEKIMMKEESDELLEIEQKKSEEAELQTKNLLAVIEKLQDELKLKNDSNVNRVMVPDKVNDNDVKSIL